MSREQLPYMSDEQFNRVAFVYRSKTDGTKVVGLLEAKTHENNTGKKNAYQGANAQDRRS